MQIYQPEVGVKRALVAFLKERGVSEAEADTRAEAKLAQAVSHVTAALRAQRGEPDVSAAFDALKTWSARNV